MNTKQKLYFAFSSIVFQAIYPHKEVSRYDGMNFHNNLSAQFNSSNQNFDMPQTIYEGMLEGVSYKTAVKRYKLIDKYLTPEIKNKFINALENILNKFSPNTGNKNLYRKLKKDLFL